MTQFGDQRTQAILMRLAVRNVPQEVERKAARTLNILAAAHSLQDARHAGHGRIAKEKGLGSSRLYVHVHAHWWVGFLWENSRASDIRLEER